MTDLCNRPSSRQRERLGGHGEERGGEKGRWDKGDARGWRIVPPFFQVKIEFLWAGRFSGGEGPRPFRFCSREGQRRSSAPCLHPICYYGAANKAMRRARWGVPRAAPGQSSRGERLFEAKPLQFSVCIPFLILCVCIWRIERERESMSMVKIALCHVMRLICMRSCADVSLLPNCHPGFLHCIANGITKLYHNILQCKNREADFTSWPFHNV